MEFDTFLNLVDCDQEIILFYEDYMLKGAQDAFGCMLSDKVYKGIVTDIAAEDGKLKVWVKEEEHEVP
jgi:hypothetical protein